MLRAYCIAKDCWLKPAFRSQSHVKAVTQLSAARSSRQAGHTLPMSEGNEALNTFIDCDAGVDDAQGEPGML